MKSRPLICLCAAMLVATVSANSSFAEVFYSNDFENVSDGLTEWSSNSTGTTPGTISHATDRFLGQLSNSTTLTLNNLPLHNQMTVSFDLYIIGSWDGNREYPGWPSPPVGPDFWFCSVQGSEQLIYTTFSNQDQYGFRQAYPGNYPAGDFQARSGAIENNTLGFLGDPIGTVQDSVYHLDFTFSHSQSDIVINFGAAGLQDLADESWGIDNITVTPEPTSLLLLSLGTLALRKFKK